MTDTTPTRVPVAAGPPLTLYIHIPWCVRKCPYCDFNSHAQDGELPESAYITALTRDLDEEAIRAAGRPLLSIFFGGGTPSLFSAGGISAILAAVRARFDLVADCEITLEANPGTFEQRRFAGYREAGVNRLSIGIQSFADEALRKLGRIHSAREAIAAVAMSREAGFDNINLDLMYGLEQQDTAAALGDLEQAIALAPQHVSWYQLTIEPNTVFYRRPPPLPGDEALAAMEGQGARLLARAGYARYEVSAWARPGRQSRHNLNYWRFGDYLGVGAGAHGKLSLSLPDAILRRHKLRQPTAYMAGVAKVAGEQPIAREQLPLEFMLNALRLRQGVSESLFEQHTGLPFASITATLERLRAAELLADIPGMIVATDLGYRFLDSVVAAFDS